MATLSQADIEAILDALVDGILKRLSYIDPPSVEIDSHDIDGILKRFTSVDALVDEILKWNPSNKDLRRLYLSQISLSITVILLEISLHPSTPFVNMPRFAMSSLASLDQALKSTSVILLASLD